jgi:hypothetical protein
MIYPTISSSLVAASSRRGPAGEWEGEREQMREGGGFQRAPSVYIQRSELGPAWVSSALIQRRGRCLGMAS